MAAVLALGALPASADTFSWKYSGIDYPSQAQAEAAMRASFAAGNDLYVCDTVDLGNQVKYTYCTPTPGVTAWFSEYEVAGYSNLCSNNNEVRTAYCASESELTAAYATEFFANNPTKCSAGSSAEGEHVNSPVEEWGRNWYNDSGTTRYYASASHVNPVYAERRKGKLLYRNCDDPDDLYTATFFINWYSHYRCPVGYNAQYESTEYQWPNVCKGPTAVIYRTGEEIVSSTPATCAPCVPATGEKLWHETDFELGGLVFQRHYASLHDQNPASGLGGKWSHSWNERLTPPASTSTGSKAKWRSDRNDTEEFVWVSGSTTLMRSERNSGRTLAKQSDGSWVLQGGGTVRAFTAAGQLASIMPLGSPAEAITFTWAGGVLASVTDARGRSATFVYSGGQLDRIEDAGGNTLVEYDYVGGNLASATYPDSKSRVYHYGETAHLCSDGGSCSPGDFADWLTGVTDERGVRILTVDYEGTGRVSSVDKPEGAEATSLSYHATQRKSTVVKAGEGTAEWTFDGTAYRRPTDKTVSDGATVIGTETWEYPTNQVRYRNRNAVATLTQLDADGRQVALVEAERKGSNVNLPEKRTTTTTWTSTSPALPAVVEVKDAGGTAVLRIENTYNARGQIQTRTVVDPVLSINRVTTWAYCEAADVSAPLSLCPIEGLVKAITAPGGAVTSFQYRSGDDSGCVLGPDSCMYRKGDLWKTINPEGHVVEVLDHDGAGRPVSVLDENGVITDLAYNDRGWVTHVAVRGVTSAGDAITVLTWTDDGKLASVTDPDGVTTTREYDGDSRLEAIEDALGNRHELVLDAAGNVVQENVKDAGGTVRRTLSRLFDGISRLETAADAFLNPTDFTYDANGNVLSITDAFGTVTQNSYDNRDRLVATTQDVGGIAASVALEYDTLDRVTQVTDPKGLDTGYSYNAFGDLLQLDSPDSGVSTFTYDAAGIRATATDARGVVATYSHDDLGRVTSVDYSGGSSEDVSFTWDVAPAVCASGETFAAGQLGMMTDGSGSTAYCYDRRGNLVRKVQTTGGVALQVRYGYTLADRLDWVIYPDGTRVDYDRDANGDISAVNVTRPGQSQQGLVSSVSYHPFGPPAAISWAGGRTQLRAIDAAGQPTRISDGSSDGLSVDFDFNAVGNLTAITEPAGSTPDDIEIDYDALGRLTAFKDAPTDTAIEAYGYDATGNRTSFSYFGASEAYAYPLDSHRLSNVDGVGRTYDAAGNTLTIGSAWTYTYGASGRMATASDGTTPASYAYTGAGEQVKRVAGGVTTLFLYDEAGQLLGQYDSMGHPIQQYVWMESLPVGVIAGGAIYHVQPDHLGTSRVVVDPDTDKAVWSWSLLGEAYGSTGPNDDPDGDSIPFLVDLRFPGQRFDPFSGLNQNYFRNYEPLTGRFPTSDPIGLLGGTSSFLYASGSPLILIDRLGLAGAVGHHYVPRAVYGKYNLPPATRNVFNKTTTGAIPGGHGWDKAHSNYNKAVSEMMDDWIKKNNIDPSKMTIDEAEDFMRKLSRSKDQRIVGYIAQLEKKMGKRLIRRAGGFVCRKFPIIAAGLFIHDTAEAGVGHAFNELVWPVSEIWNDEEN